MKPLRIGNGCGFWGDNLDAPVFLTDSGRLDYLTLEYLAELTMSILALQKQKDPEAGYATDFLDVLKRLTPHLTMLPRSDLKIITNAGGMNPLGCARQARRILDAVNRQDMKIAVVTGDDLLPQLDELLAQGHRLNHLDHGTPLESIRSQVVSANAYLGANPIVEGLARGAALVITGRVADASLTVAPAIHEFGWSLNDHDALASATVAGHLIECGAQVSGGIWTNWQEANDLAFVGYPIAEIDATGKLVITKAEGSGGAINRETVSEQLLYEVGDPANYLTPDVVADFTTVQLHEMGKDRVEILHSKGKPATASYKVSVAYRNGYTSSGTLVISGPNAVKKAQAAGEMILNRLARCGMTYQKSLIELLGTGACAPGVLPQGDPPEVVLRLSVQDPLKGRVERFTREFAPLVTSGPPGVTGYTTGRPPVREVFAYWPCLIEKTAVDPFVKVETL
jgi:hypothetical protein